MKDPWRLALHPAGAICLGLLELIWVATSSLAHQGVLVPLPPPSPTVTGSVVTTAEADGGGKIGLSNRTTLIITTDGNNTFQMPGGVRLRSEVWVIPLIAVATFNVLVIFVFELFVLYKAYGTNPSRRHLFLGQMLLLGLFLSSCVGFTPLPTPHWLTCAILRLGLGLGYALVFGTLLVKTVFLLSLHSGVYLPASYQGLLLFFIIAVQVAIGVQWLMQRPPATTLENTDSTACNADLQEMLLGLTYDMFLICSVALLAMRARGLRENHREALFIGVATAGSIPLWAAWILIAASAHQRHLEACLAFGSVGTATLVFLLMFLPKGRQLAAMGREGLYPEDRDALSSPSPSVYTPSFLHLRPTTLPFAINQSTLFKPASKGVSPDRVYYLPPPPGRMWRFGFSSYPPLSPGLPPTDDPIYYNGDRYMSYKPSMKFFRGPPLY